MQRARESGRGVQHHRAEMVLHHAKPGQCVRCPLGHLHDPKQDPQAFVVTQERVWRAVPVLPWPRQQAVAAGVLALARAPLA